MSFENISLVYNPSIKLAKTNNSDQKVFQNLSKLADKYFSKLWRGNMFWLKRGRLKNFIAQLKH